MLDEQTAKREAGFKKIADKALQRQGNFLETVVAKEKAKEEKFKTQMNYYIQKREATDLRIESERK